MVFEVFEAKIKLEKVTERTKSLIETLNNTSVAGSAMMVVLDAFPISDTNEILGKIYFTVNDDLKVVFGVITPNIDELMLFASRFNMASAMRRCTIRYSLTSECLNVKFKPPDEKLEEVLRDFFELTEKSSNWIVENDNSVWQHIHPTDSHWVSVGINLKKEILPAKYFFLILLLFCWFWSLFSFWSFISF